MPRHTERQLSHVFSTMSITIFGSCRHFKSHLQLRFMFFFLNHSIFILWPTPKARKRNLFSLLVISLGHQTCMQEESFNTCYDAFTRHPPPPRHPRPSRRPWPSFCGHGQHGRCRMVRSRQSRCASGSRDGQ